ncbi:Bestrophin domain containing protein [Aphelenchoides fujianensis]|nr:Bestrophin domain containing protein [Aphelenchoides fujianensis]
MTVQYTLDVSQTTTRSILRLLFRWRGSVWKGDFPILPQLILWLVIYCIISAIYRYLLSEYHQDVFASLVRYLDHDLSKYIPLSFLLGFFVSEVVKRWQHIIDGVGWIDTSAVNFATLIRGNDEETRILRRTLIRYMVLNQALVLRDISLQARRRYPTLETLIAGGLITPAELEELERIPDPYTRYWFPIHWCYGLLYEAKEQKKIASDHLLEIMLHEIQHFRSGLAKLLKFDWIPLPLVYPQVVFFAVRLYFFICLISRQHIVHERKGADANMLDFWIPVKTVCEFFVFIGWTKVAEALLNPLGTDDDDVEVNYVLDANLRMGFTLVDRGGMASPPLIPDKFYNNDEFAPLYSLEAAKRTVFPMVGSASQVNLVKGKSEITMLPHKSTLGVMTEDRQEANTILVDVQEHNARHAAETKQQKAVDPDATLQKIRKRAKTHNHPVPVITTPHNVPIHPEDRHPPPRNSYAQRDYERSPYMERAADRDRSPYRYDGIDNYGADYGRGPRNGQPRRY